MSLKRIIKLTLSMKLIRTFSLTVDLEFVSLTPMMKTFWSVKKRSMMAIQLMRIRKEFQSIMGIMMNKVTVEMVDWDFPGMRPSKIFKEIWENSSMNLRRSLRVLWLLSLLSLLSSIWLKIQAFSRIVSGKKGKT